MFNIDSFWQGFVSLASNVNIPDIVDIAIVTYIFYKVYTFIKDTRAEQVLKGMLFLLVATKVSEIFNLHTLYWMLENTLTVGLIAVLIIFQPELRSGLEYIGRTKFTFLGKNNYTISEDELKKDIEEIVECLYSLSRQKIGALIIMERDTRIGEVINTGTIIDAEISRQLLINIFIPNTPLHDGAVVIRDGKVKAAACFLPLTESKDLSKDLGTRHRAAIGVSEISDCLSLIVSEETGAVSIAKSGKLYRNMTKERLTNILRSNLKSSDQDQEKGFLKGGIFR
ncbi:diadenylate cyclase CdaA [Paraclostridium bifermentans]|uniref:Diadenylate cyclase n=1 Tax=Paraclostridium bifermentans ATCC 638 = DSM 14991 TaxID=1233171 RepID=T4VP18_PARBF|nr:diadenylate cyclase CdaA [Paraclostridium bifermentans]EQK45449.1 disA bacterial checkpoint controller nucleotide-binding family protein [[Clostridium] bifermentans ATCC 638] [Paraclostridium bifermentans ATCC 638 = DSM 14991]MBS6509961.1 diadenylate cyclase CdaA [Paraclostridium bifermentans]MCE9676461.1 diadenylate cyclase CdaA [Paraclostridium bifermentans]MDU3338163.1 diadenylate cyclase CdaA [Paraclostridium bifermentans]MDU3804407.1 diadenylate cyclase CdaA [Paraclostridium bifermenta